MVPRSPNRISAYRQLACQASFSAGHMNRPHLMAPDLLARYAVPAADGQTLRPSQCNNQELSFCCLGSNFMSIWHGACNARIAAHEGTRAIPPERAHVARTVPTGHVSNLLL